MDADGDAVRGLGFVSLFSAHLEHRVNLVLNLFSLREEFSDEDRIRPISQRIATAIRLAKALKGPRVSELLAELERAKELFSQRNVLLHGSIWDAPYGEDGKYLFSTIPDTEPKKMSADSVYQLAKELHECWGRMGRPLLSVAKELAASG